MNKCLKITVVADYKEGFLHNFIQKHARKLNLEGTVQVIDAEAKIIRIVVCGDKDNVESFLDVLHKGTPSAEIEGITVEPFLKDKDYRKVFRVIE